MTDSDFDADLVGEVLQLALPQPQARAVAATPVSGDEQSFGLGIANAADLLPPATDKAEVQRLQQLANHRMADPMPLRAKFGCEPTQDLS